MSAYGPSLRISQQIHQEKYRVPGESFEDSMNRVARALADNSKHEHVLKDILLNQRFLPAGRIQTGAGTTKAVTLYNCLAGNTKILTLEYGAIEIEKLVNKQVTLLDGNLNWVKAPIYYHGEQEVVDLTFKNGYESVVISSTLEHGWVTPNKNLVLLTKVFVNEDGRRDVGHLAVSKHVKGLTDEYKQGVLHGIIYGDGSVDQYKNAKIRVCSHHESIEPWLQTGTKTYPESCGGDPVYYFSHTKTPQNLKELPLNTSPEYLLGFLRGWFAADGCVSTQPEATLCADEKEQVWLEQWGPLVGWHVRGFTKLSTFTNFGKRKKQSRNIRLKSSGLIKEDFLIEQHKIRWKEDWKDNTWRVHGHYMNKRVEKVYCPVVSTTQSFALSSGIHSRNCFVSGDIHDNFTGQNGIMQRATEAAETMRRGGGVGYNFGTLRPRNDIIGSLGSPASGPVSFMHIYDAVCKTVSSAGHRRGAQMGILPVSHPDIEEFIEAKQNDHSLTAFNISIGITDDFMHSLRDGRPYTLKFGSKQYKTVDPKALWEKIMRSTWDYAEPGVIFLDQINRMNNLWYCENISATNPCSEQPLPPHGACLLGSFNLVKYITRDLETGGFTFHWARYINDITHVVRAMDNVVDTSLYPLPEQRDEALNKRRMGLGITGFANLSEILGFSYGSEKSLLLLEGVLKTLRDVSYHTSVELAKEKGAFKLFDKEKYLEGSFIKTLPNELKESIYKHGIRNSHLTSIAPTGTISIAADNISSGIEPVFSVGYMRKLNLPGGQIEEFFSDYAYRNFKVIPKTADQLSADEHLKVLTVAQKYVDSAVSKTCNVNPNMPWDDFKQLYWNAWQNGCKGLSTFNVGGKRAGILTTVKEEKKNEVVDDEQEGMACYIDPLTGQKSCG